MKRNLEKFDSWYTYLSVTVTDWLTKIQLCATAKTYHLMQQGRKNAPKKTFNTQNNYHQKDCKDHTIMLGVSHTYVPMVTNYMYQKVTADESQVPYNIACNLSIEDIRILAFYTISSFRCLHYIIMGILPSLSSKAFILPYH